MFKKSISIIITLMMLISTFSAVSLTSYADPDPDVGDYNLWVAHADTFGGDPDYFHLRGYSTSSILTASNSTTGEISFSAEGGNYFLDWFPTLTVNSPYTLMFDKNNEISVSFYLNDDMEFGNLNGYNGCVSLGFYAPTEFCGANQKFTALPDNLNYTSYLWKAANYWTYDYAYRETGPMGAGICEAGNGGIAIDLLPSANGNCVGTRNVTQCRISSIASPEDYYYEQDSITGEDILQGGNTYYNEDFSTTIGSIDLSYETTVKIKWIPYSYDISNYIIYINDIPLRTFSAPRGTPLYAPYSGFKFAINVTAGSATGLLQFNGAPASITLTDVQGIPAGVFPSTCGQIMYYIHELGDISQLPYNDYNKSRIEYYMYEVEHFNATQYGWYCALGEMSYYYAMQQWYNAGYGNE